MEGQKKKQGILYIPIILRILSRHMNKRILSFAISIITFVFLRIKNYSLIL